MTVSVADILRAVKKALGPEERRQAEALERLARIVSGYPSERIATLPAPAKARSGHGGSDVAALADVLERFRPLFRLLAPKPERAGLDRLQRLVITAGSMSLRDLLQHLESALGAAPAEARPEVYVQALEQAVEDETAFPQVVEQLDRDPGVDRAALVEVASRFAYKLPKRASRATALAAIRKVHQDLLQTRKNVAAQRGTSAA